MATKGSETMEVRIHLSREGKMNPTRGYPVRPDPFNIRVGYGFSLKKPEAGSGRVRVLGIPGPNPTRIYNIKKKKKKTLSINSHFSPKSLRSILTL